MWLKTSMPIEHLARVVRSALLGHICVSAQNINIFSQEEILKVVPPEVATYVKKEALDSIKVLITVSFISFEWHILIPDPTFFFGQDIHIAVIQVLVAYASVLRAARCGLDITKGPIGGRLRRILRPPGNKKRISPI